MYECTVPQNLLENNDFIFRNRTGWVSKEAGALKGLLSLPGLVRRRIFEYHDDKFVDRGRKDLIPKRTRYPLRLVPKGTETYVRFQKVLYPNL